MLRDGETTQFRSETYVDPAVQTELWRCGQYLAPDWRTEETEGSSGRFAASDFGPPMQLLDSAVAHLRCGDWPVASAEYAAAIRMADSIDRWELWREREWLRRRFDTENDPVARRWMSERDRMLHDMERAPGFTRANLGLLLIRLGHFAEGFGLISRAAQLDPEMRMDPNFRRHIAMAIGAANVYPSMDTGSTIAEGRLYSSRAPVYPAEIPLRANIDARRAQVDGQSATIALPNNGASEWRRYPAQGATDRAPANPSNSSQTGMGWRGGWNYVTDGGSGQPSQESAGTRRPVWIRDPNQSNVPAQGQSGDRQSGPPLRQSGTDSSVPQDAYTGSRERPDWRQSWNNVSPIAPGGSSGRAPDGKRDPSQPLREQGVKADPSTGEPVWKPKQRSANPWKEAIGETTTKQDKSFEQTEALINRSLGRVPGKYDFELRAALGGLGAAFSGGPMHWLANKAADWRLAKSPDGPLSELARRWQKHFDLRQEATVKLANAESATRSAQASIDNIVRGIESRLASATISSAEAGQLALRKRMLSSPLESVESIKRAQLVGSIAAEDFAALTAREQAIARATTAEKMLQSASRLSGEGFGKNFGKGLALAGTVQIADHFADKYLFGKDHGARASWYTDSLLLPLSFIGPKSWGGKAVAVAASTVAGWVVDRFVPPEKNSEYGKLLRPRCDESILMGMAMLFPLRQESALARSLMIGGVWVGGRIANALGGPSKREVFDSIAEKVEADRQDRTAQSMNEAIDEVKSFALSSRQGNAKVTLEAERRAAEIPKGNPEDAIGARRSLAIYLAARGEARLDEGAFMGLLQGRPTSSAVGRALSTTDQSHQYDFILAGYGLDLGLQALPNLIEARKQINQAIQLTQSKVSEVEGLEAVGKRIDRDIERVYGPHDIRKIYEELQQAERVNLQVMTKFGLQIVQKAEQSAHSDDKRAAAKLCRDAALLQLAFAGFKAGHNGVGNGADGEGAAVVHSTAVRYLQYALKLDPENPDNKELQSIADELAGLIKDRQTRQSQNSVNNPLRIDNRAGA